MQKHDLHHEFPEFENKIHELKISDHHFKKLFDEYHEVNNSINRIESNAEPTTDEVLNEYRLRRVKLKDELYGMLNNL